MGQPAPDVNCHDLLPRDGLSLVTPADVAEVLEPQALSRRHDLTPNLLAEVTRLIPPGASAVSRSGAASAAGPMWRMPAMRPYATRRARPRPVLRNKGEAG